MLQTSTEDISILPFVVSSQNPGDPPPERPGDPPPNGGSKIKPSKVTNQPPSTEPQPADDDIIIKGG